MSPETLLAFFGLVLAVWAIVPSDRLSELRIRLSWLDWSIAIVSILILHYILYFPVFDSLGLAPELGPWRWGFTPETASYAVIAVAAALLVIRAFVAKLKIDRVAELRRLIEELLFSGRYAEAIFLFEKHLDRLVRFHRMDYLSARLRSKLLPSTYEYLGDEGRRLMEQSLGSKRFLLAMIPNNRVMSEGATELLRRMVVDESFVQQLSNLSPYLGLRVIAEDIPEKKEFLNYWICALLQTRSSVLFYEIENNQNVELSGRYAFVPSNRLINSVFRDSNVAVDLATYRPVGEFVIGELDVRRDSPDSDRYNRALDDFATKERWKDPICASLRVFEFIVVDAAFAGVKWHMWLYYFPHFVEAFERNIHPRETVDLTNEWPTPYHYFLCESVSLLCNWIRVAEYLDEPNIHASLVSVDTQHQNEHIPKSACIALGSVWFKIVASDKIADSFKVYLLEVIFSELLYLKDSERLTRLQGVSILALSGESWHAPASILKHRQRTLALLARIDRFKYHKLADELSSKF
jgi:hypothetical protein